MAKPYLHCHHRFKNGKDHCSWSIAEKVRTRQGWVQRHLLYLGESNDSQKAAWTKVTAVFDTMREQTRALALYPADREAPAHAVDYGMQARLSEFVLRRPRQWGACWGQALETLTVYRLMDPGSEWRLHRQWFHDSAHGRFAGGGFWAGAERQLVSLPG